MIAAEHIDSVHLRGNLLGDPSERDLFVYLPPGYGSSDRRYPTAYLLHWFGATAAGLVTPDTEGLLWAPPLEDILEPVFRRMGARGMIVVVPDGWTSYGCSQWVDSPVNGNFERYVVEDVVRFVDDRFSTIPRAGSRGVLGYSSGGFGAWHLGTRHPEVFGAMAMLSADSYFDLSHLPFVYGYLAGIFPEPPAGPIEGNALSSLTYALAACYSPNPDNPPWYVDLPVDYRSGDLLGPVWEQWLRYDMVVNWRERLDALQRLRGILLDVGRRDEFSLQWGHRRVSHALTGAGIPHLATEHPGDHGGRIAERHQHALLWLSGVLDPEP